MPLFAKSGSYFRTIPKTLYGADIACSGESDHNGEHLIVKVGNNTSVWASATAVSVEDDGDSVWSTTVPEPSGGWRPGGAGAAIDVTVALYHAGNLEDTVAIQVF